MCSGCDDADSKEQALPKSVSTSLAFVARLPVRQRAAVWREALPVASSKELDAISTPACADLVRCEQGSLDSTRIATGLAMAWQRLTPEAQAKIASLKCAQRALDGLARGAGDASRADGRQTLEGLLCAARVVRSPALIALLPGAFARDADALGDIAEQTLLALARSWRSLAPASQVALDSAIVETAARDAVLRRATPLLAGLLAPADLSPRVQAWLASDDEAALMALRTAVRRLRGVAGKRWALRLSSRKPVARAALEVLATSSAASPAQVGELLRDWPLLLAPRRLAHVQDAGGRIWRNWLGNLAGESERTTGRDPAASDAEGGRQLEVAIWVAAVAPAAIAKKYWLGALTHTHASVRQIAVRSLVMEGAEAALEDFVFDASSAVARTALVGLMRRSPTRYAAIGPKIRRSPHASLRRFAHAASSLSVGQWRDAAALGVHDRWTDPASFNRALAVNRPAALAALRCNIAQGTPAQRVWAILLAVRCGVAREIELELLGAVATFSQQSDELRVVATAISALGRAGTRTAREAVTRFVAHPRARVRANAIEALGIKASVHDALQQALSDPAPRVRANAAVSLMEAVPMNDAPRSVVAEMLEERSANGDRLAALWAVERLRLVEHACAVATIASSADVDERTRARATRCARRLLASMNSGVSELPAESSGDRS